MSDTNAGIVLLTVVAIAFGGSFLLRVVSGHAPANQLQKTYFRAGHAHAGVLVILGLVIGLYLRDANAPGWAEAMSSGVLLGAILMPLGFFTSVIGKDPEKPNAMRFCIAAGGIAVAVGAIGAGLGLILAP